MWKIRRFLKYVSFYNRRALELGLTPNQLYYMLMIAATSPTSSMIARALSYTNGAVTQMVDALIKRGYVMRVPNNTDRRAHRIILTNKGETIMELVQKR